MTSEKVNFLPGTPDGVKGTNGTVDVSVHAAEVTKGETLMIGPYPYLVTGVITADGLTTITIDTGYSQTLLAGQTVTVRRVESVTASACLRPVVPAPANTPCGWRAYGETGNKLTCQSGRPAVHILTSTLPVATEGTALCGLHSPYDVTEADKYATWVDGMAADPGVEIIDGEPYGKVSGLPIFRNQADNTPGILARHRARKAAEAVTEADRVHAAEVAEADQSGMDTLADMLTLDTPAEVSAVRSPASLVKFHRLSAPMVSVLLAVGALRGRADAWHMRNVIIRGATGATRATVKALISRGILAEVISEDNTPGVSLTFYVVTERGAEILAALGCPITFLPADQAEAEEYVRKAAVRPGDCSDGCEVAEARSLPVGGMVCLGCGCTFTRSGEDTHPGILAVSEAVVRRNVRVRGY